MAGSAEEIWNKAVDLSLAWLKLIEPDLQQKYNVMVDMKNDNYDHAARKSEETSLKVYFLSLIENGYLDAYGRDIINSIDAEISKLPNSLFNQHAKGFEIEWGANKIFVRNRTIIDVRLVSAEPRNVQTGLREANKKPAHRPNVDDAVIPAIKKLEKEIPDFWSLGQSRQCELVREEIHGPNAKHNPPKGFGDGAIKKRLRDLKRS